MSGNTKSGKVTFKDGVLRYETDFIVREARVGDVYVGRSFGGKHAKKLPDVKFDEVLEDLQTVIISTVGGSEPGKRRATEAMRFLQDYAPVVEDKKPHGKRLSRGKGGTLSMLLAEQRRTNELLERLLAVWDADGRKTGTGG